MAPERESLTAAPEACVRHLESASLVSTQIHCFGNVNIEPALILALELVFGFSWLKEMQVWCICSRGAPDLA